MLGLWTSRVHGRESASSSSMQVAVPIRRQVQNLLAASRLHGSFRFRREVQSSGMRKADVVDSHSMYPLRSLASREADGRQKASQLQHARLLGNAGSLRS